MAYGADPDRWPLEHRESLSLALANDPALRACAADEAKLDQLMTSESIHLPITVDSILDLRTGRCSNGYKADSVRSECGA